MAHSPELIKELEGKVDVVRHLQVADRDIVVERCL
jgi:hypothetical protein